MSYNLVASTDQYSKIVEIHEWNGTESLSLFLKDIIEVKGINRTDKYTPHLPHEIQLPVIDLSNNLIALLRNRHFTDFKLFLKDKDTSDILYEGYINTRFTGHKFANSSNVLILSAFDGISLLQKEDIPYTEFDQIPLGDLLVELIHSTGIELDVIVSTDIEHDGQVSPSGIIPNGIRVNPAAFVRGVSEPKKLDLLKAILNYFKFQLFQEDGVWRVVERDIRSAGTYSDYNITDDTHASVDKSVTIARSELTTDPTEDSIDPARFERVIFLKESTYSWLNPTFEYDVDELDNPTELPDWIVSDQADISGDQGGMLLLDAAAIVYQRPLVPVKSDSQFNFKFSAELRWKSGLDPGAGQIRVDIAEIIAYNAGSGSYYTLNPTSRGWSSGGTDKVSAVITSSSYSQQVDFDFEGTTDGLPAGEYNLIMRLFCEGDTADLDELPRFIHCELSPVDVELSYLRKTTTYEPAEGELISEEVSASEPHNFLHWSDFEYNDGTDWNPTDDWGSGQALDDLIVAKLSASGLNRDHVVDLPIVNSNIKLLNTVDYTIDGVLRTYVPAYIKTSQRNKITQAKLIQSKLDTIGGLRRRYTN